MDGAKIYYRYFRDYRKIILVDRRAFCVEVLSKEKMEREALRILVLVRSDCPENGQRRKRKVSLALSFNQGLVST